MTIIDRYLLKLFFKIFLICLISFSGLFVVIHLFTNLDELVAAGEKSGGVPKMMAEFYLPRLLDMFDRMSGILVLISGIFALSMMQRRREMTAVQAAGISKSRLVLPIVIASLLIIGLSVVNREKWIPQVRQQLVRSPENWNNTGTVPMNFHKEHNTGLLVRGDKIIIDEGKITEPDIQIPLYLSKSISRVHAEYGRLEEAKEWRPAGLYLTEVSFPDDLSGLKNISLEGKPIVYFPDDNDWLKANQCYVVCNLDVHEMAFGKQLAQYSTLKEMMASLRKPRQWFGHRQQVEVHNRILKPVIDLSLLFLGLPLAIGRIEQNIFTSVGLCLLVVLGIQATVLCCSTLGANSLIQPAALAAWLPVIIFFPLAVLAMRRLKK